MIIVIEPSGRKSLQAMKDISSTLQEQNSASSQIAGNVERIARMGEENGAAVRKLSNTAGIAGDLSSNLQALVGHFKVA